MPGKGHASPPVYHQISLCPLECQVLDGTVRRSDNQAGNQAVGTGCNLRSAHALWTRELVLLLLMVVLGQAKQTHRCLWVCSRITVPLWGPSSVRHYVNGQSEEGTLLAAPGPTAAPALVCSTDTIVFFWWSLWRAFLCSLPLIFTFVLLSLCKFLISFLPVFFFVSPWF
jgi:hypothetical protein